MGATSIHWVIAVLAIMLPVLIWCVKRKKLTRAAGITAAVLGMLVLAMGLNAVAMLLAFFVMGVWATSHKKKTKQAIQEGMPHSESRTALQVLANGGVAGICGLLSILDPNRLELYILMAAGSLAAASADTLSSELGTVYGKRFVNILSFKNDKKGLDGVVSVEGTLAGLAGAILIAIIYSIAFGITGKAVAIIIAGVIGNLADSVLGATIERKGFVGNDFVNACNTAIGAILAWLPMQVHLLS